MAGQCWLFNYEDPAKCPVKTFAISIGEVTYNIKLENLDGTTAQLTCTADAAEIETGTGMTTEHKLCLYNKTNRTIVPQIIDGVNQWILVWTDDYGLFCNSTPVIRFINRKVHSMEKYYLHK